MAEIFGIPLDLSLFYGAVPGLAALAISVWNWLQWRKGAILQPNEIINYGLWGIEYKEKKNKALFIPIMITNTGLKPGMVKDIVIEFATQKGVQEIEIRRKVNLIPTPVETLKSMNINDYRTKSVEEINPFYPIFVNWHDNVSVMIEAFDGKNAIPIGEDTECTISVIYNNNNMGSITFPFRIDETDFEKSRDHLIWLRPSETI